MAKINNWELEKFIITTVSFLVENAEALASRKWPNMYRIDNYLDTKKTVFRIHSSNVFPQMVQLIVDGKMIEEICDEFNEGRSPIEYDRSSMWFTIHLD